MAPRLRRLDEMKGLLAGREHVTAAELSDELGVSLRTVRRDLEFLRDNGLPVEADRGRGGGLPLHRRFSLGGLQLSPGEAIDVLLSLVIAEQMGSPVLLRELPSVRRKIASAFAPGHRQIIQALRLRVLVGKPASPTVVATYAAPQRRAL